MDDLDDEAAVVALIMAFSFELERLHFASAERGGEFQIAVAAAYIFTVNFEITIRAIVPVSVANPEK